MSNAKRGVANLNELTSAIIAFRDARDWKQFHNPKDVALSLVLEAAEVMEHFQWKGAAETARHVVESKEEIGEELADVLYWVLLMSHDLKIDIATSLRTKLAKNEAKYPVEKARGSSAKYTEFRHQA
jgi:NTP pyrophosphatase (non-canonical NTP hydrolase)